MEKNIIIVGLLCLCVWMGHRIVVLENYHYASQLNFCNEYANGADLVKREKCLNNTETRTSWWWNLTYGLKIF